MTEASPIDPFEAAKQFFVDGLACLQAGRLEEAEQHFLSSLDLLPGRISTLVNLAATRLKLARPREALEVADQILAVEPENVDAWFHRGNALAALGRQPEALVSYEQLLALDARHSAAWFLRGQTLQMLGRVGEALAAYERAVAIDPGLALAWSARGGLLREMNRLDEAGEAFKQAIAHGGDAELNGYYLASVGAQVPPPAAPKRYVQSLFDDYADQFEEHLVQGLGYRGYAVLVQPLAGLAAAGRFRSALDLGCGTGLCGPLVKPIAAHLVGVDLSSQMLEKARSLRVYDRLEHAELIEYLSATDERHDLVLAADVFPYIGDLSPVFGAVHKVLDGGGVFCFSSELAAEGGPGFELRPGLRYVHSERYLRELSADVGFEVVKLHRQPVRQEQRHAIEGLYVYLTRR